MTVKPGMGITVIGGVTGVVRFTVAYDFTWMNTVRLAEISAQADRHIVNLGEIGRVCQIILLHLELDMAAVVRSLAPAAAAPGPVIPG